MPPLMTLRILLPFRIFAEARDVVRVVAETTEGSLGLLPHRLDCVAPLVPGILVYERETGGEAFAAVGEGVLVKCGPEVTVSVRHAAGGRDLDRLDAAVDREFRELTEREQRVRAVMTRMENDVLKRLAEIGHD